MASMDMKQHTFDEWVESIQGEPKSTNDGTVNLKQSANESAHEAVQQSHNLTHSHTQSQSETGARGSLQQIGEKLARTAQSAGDNVKGALNLGGNKK